VIPPGRAGPDGDEGTIMTNREGKPKSRDTAKALIAVAIVCLFFGGLFTSNCRTRAKRLATPAPHCERCGNHATLFERYQSDKSEDDWRMVARCQDCVDWYGWPKEAPRLPSPIPSLAAVILCGVLFAVSSAGAALLTVACFREVARERRAEREAARGSRDGPVVGAHGPVAIGGAARPAPDTGSVIPSPPGTGHARRRPLGTPTTVMVVLGLLAANTVWALTTCYDLMSSARTLARVPWPVVGFLIAMLLVQVWLFVGVLCRHRLAWKWGQFVSVLVVLGAIGLSLAAHYRNVRLKTPTLGAVLFLSSWAILLLCLCTSSVKAWFKLYCPQCGETGRPADALFGKARCTICDEIW
jgi:hypothetical protein